MALTDEDVGRNVRDLRAERGMTQAALASRVYLARTAVSRLETGQRAVTVPELAAIAAVLGVDVGYLAVPSRMKPRVTAIRTTYEPPVSTGFSRPRWARIPARWPGPPAAVWAISRRWFKKTKLVVRDGLISRAEQNWEQMVRARHMALGRLDVASYSSVVRDPEPRHALKYGG